MKEKKTIAMIGGAGFIGHHTAIALKKQGHDVFILDSLYVNNLLYLASTMNNMDNREIYLKMINQRLELLRNHDIQLYEGDTLYMFSDGFPDQFGGPDGKKYKYKPFKKLLIENYQSPMKEQGKILDKEIEDWKGYLDTNTGKPYEQIDDICVIGIRI